MTKLTAKSSTIFIATAGRTDVYHSLEEVPPTLRGKLQETTRGVNSATILIADKGGREELVRALQGRSTTVQCRLTENVRTREHDLTCGPQKGAPLSIRTWVELLLPVAIGASLWLFIGSRF
jgi:hypothetical protein